MAEISVKYFHSAMAGAPVLSGTAGALKDILAACLVSGFGLKSVVSLSVVGGVATASYSAGHPFVEGATALFAGATPADLNGEKRVLATSGSTVSFAAPGVADGAATGTITSRVAAAGWQELYAGTTNVLVLAPTVPEATQCALRVDDNGATTARVVGYESMSSASAGTGAFPSAAQQASGLYWGKSNAADATPRPWMLWADAQQFVLYVAPHASNPTHGVLYGSGDMLAEKSGDAFSNFLNGGATAAEVTTSGSPVEGCLGYANGISAGKSLYVARAATGIGSAQLLKKVAAHNTAAAYSGMAAYNGNALKYPNGPDNSLRLSPLELLGDEGLRGAVAGVLHTPQGIGGAFAAGDTINGEGVFAGRKLVAVRVGPPGGAVDSAGTAFIDASGPWRS